MKILEIRFDTRTDYQDFVYEDFDGDPVNTWPLTKFGKLSPEWRMPDIYIPEPKLEKPNFYSVCFGRFFIILDEYAVEKIRTVLDMSGQLVPFMFKDTQLYIFKPTHCFDLLDDQKAEWEVFNGKRLHIAKYVFKKKRVTLTCDSPIFTIPECNSSTMFYAEGAIGDEKEELTYCIEKYNLKGLQLIEVWSE